MITRKPRKSKTSGLNTGKVTCRKKVEEINTNIPVIYEENLHYEDFMKVCQNMISQEKIPEVLIPQIKVRCEPLNVEKVIDLVNNKVVSEGQIKKTQAKRGKKTQEAKSKTKSATSCAKAVDVIKESNSPAQNKKSLKRTRKKLQEDNYDKNLELTPDESDDSKRKTELKTLSDTDVKQCKFVQSTTQKCEVQSSDGLNIKTSNNQAISNLTASNSDDVTDFIELSDLSLEELAPFIDVISEVDLKMKSDEGGNEKNKNNEEDLLKDTSSVLNFNDSSDLSEKTNSLDQGNQDLENPSKSYLQVAVESFMNNPQLKYLKENTALKKGLCFSWLSNNYKCFNEQCLYSHNAVNLFTRKLNLYPSKFIITVVVSMRNDVLFADMIIAAFKVLSERKLPIVWVTFLTFFVFYVTEPSDSRFLKFWANAARFFCQLNQNYAAANGFASLLSIFTQGEKSETWKIIEFIKIIKAPPVQVPTSFALLQPVLIMEDIPPEFLTEAVESCIATQKDVLNVYSLIIPKISIMTSPIQVVELLVKFCDTLEQTNHGHHAEVLRQGLREKVLSFKTKISRDYPLTAALQEEMRGNGNCIAITVNIRKLRSSPSQNILENTRIQSNFFQLEEDFYSLMNEAMELSPGTFPSPYRKAFKPDRVGAIPGSMEEDICERQVNRIKQFFRDCQFDLLAKYLNELRPNVVERAAEEFVKLLFQMKISLQQSVDLIKIIVLPSKTENSARVIASISITLIINLVRINEWDKAFTILSLCRERQINLLEGKVFHFNGFNTITQCRILLLFIEIYTYKEDYVSAVDLVKKNGLFSSNTSLWQLTWKACDETVRVRILEDLFQKIISKQLTETAFTLFEMIWKEQKLLLGPVDLRKFINEILILLLNQNSEEGVTLYEKIKHDVQLSDTTVRALLVTLFRCNRLVEAKKLFLSQNQTAYSRPEVMFGSSVIRILSFWLEEEIYVTFDAFFDFLAAKKHSFNTAHAWDFEIEIQVTKPNMAPGSNFRPLCLGIINPTFKDACTRIQRVLQYQFNPAVKLIIMPYCLKLDVHSVKAHLQRRMSQNLL